jgi:hypothetical protein
LAKTTRSWIGFAIGLALIAGNAHAQTGSAGSSVSMIGKISSITGSAITVMSNSGPAVVKFADETIIRGEVPVKFSDISSGMYTVPGICFAASHNQYETILDVLGKANRLSC